jgi:hypothetical protein
MVAFAGTMDRFFTGDFCALFGKPALSRRTCPDEFGAMFASKPLGSVGPRTSFPDCSVEIQPIQTCCGKSEKKENPS